MGSFVDFITSINKIALLAFMAVFGFLVFEVRKMFDDKKKNEKPVVPRFDDTIIVPPQNSVVNNTPLKPLIPVKKAEKGITVFLMIGIGIIALIGFAVLLVISTITNLKKQKVAATSVPIVREITSAGLKMFNKNWLDISEKKDSKALPGDKLYIGIQTIEEADIDRARIKINSSTWQISDITTLFNPVLKVYYREYTVATGTAQLTIDAQLHSASDGWLGD